MANGIKTGDPHGFNKGRSSKFHEDSRVRQTPEEGRRSYRPKRCGNNNKDEDNSPKNLHDKNKRRPKIFSKLNKIPMFHVIIKYLKKTENKGKVFWNPHSLTIVHKAFSFQKCVSARTNYVLEIETVLLS